MDAFDSTFLTFLFVPNAPIEVDCAKERIDDLIGRIHGSGNRILVPTPALAELLIRVGHSRSNIINLMTKSPKFLVAAFDTKASIELALIAEAEKKLTGHKKGDSTATWSKVKFDWQIIAIAKANNVSTIYSEDGDIRKLAPRYGIAVKSVNDLDLPPKQLSNGGKLFEYKK